jgi:hypothetical protein
MAELRWSLSYAEIERVLARLHGATTGEIQQKAFRGRLKHLKRLGIPQGIHPGRGAKIYYFEEQLFEWAFCLELAEFGLDPTVIVRLMNDYWRKDILRRLMAVRANPWGDGGERDDDVYFVANPALMSATWGKGRQPLPYRWMKLSQAPTWIARLLGEQRRAIVINVTDLLRQIGHHRITFRKA